MAYNIIAFAISVYFSIAIGLYFKAQTFRTTIVNKKKAFIAPLWWVLSAFIIALDRNSPKALLIFILMHPYLTLLSCFVTIANSAEPRHVDTVYVVTKPVKVNPKINYRHQIPVGSNFGGKRIRLRTHKVSYAARVIEICKEIIKVYKTPQLQASSKRIRKGVI